MDAGVFVQGLEDSVLQENLGYYRRTLDEFPVHEVKDAYWKDTISLYRALNAKNQEVLLGIVRQVQVDTISNVLGILDGTSQLGDLGLVDFDLTHRASGQRLEYLQDAWLEITE